MDFAFTDEQKIMVRTLREFAKKELLPKYAQWDRKEEFPFEQWKKIAGLGLSGLRVSSEYGGQEADCVTVGIAAEEIARGDVNCGYAVLMPWIVVDILEKSAGEKLKQEWLPLIVKGERIVGLGLTEPHCGSDAAAIRTQAVRKGDIYVLKGEKSATSLMMVADAIIVFAKTDPQAGARGVSAFLVPTGLPGIMRQSYADMGSKSIARGSIFMDELEIPAENLIGKEGGAFGEIMNTFDCSRILIALMCIGAAGISLEETIRYTKERSAFGQPLSKFQGISFSVVENYTMLEAMRLLCYRGLWLRDQGLPHAMQAAMCKWSAPKVCVDIIHNCLLLHGHYGYTQEFPFEQRLRDVTGLEIADGTANVQKIIIARELYGREFV